MTIGPPAGQQLVLFCNCAHYDVIPQAVREQVFRSLSGTGATVEVVPDLCGLAANHDPRLQEWVQASSLTIVACFPRAVRWLFHAAGAPLPEGRVQFFNMRTQPAEEIIEGLSIGEKQSASSFVDRQSSIVDCRSNWVPWFPVIDYGRCVNCQQCLNFCLFGVYGLSDDGRVEVHKPSGCKTNCPACARMCPQQAIIFPKYADAPINGDDVGAGPRACPDNGQSQEGQPQGGAPAGDLYERIRNRSAGGKRFSTQTGDPSLNRSCPMLDSLKRELNIPDDVLASLSPAEMQRIMARSKSDSNPDAGKKDPEHHE
jgi:NAD-dependent dihydropyrimidine dehydrogenase PreA subunit